MCIAMVSQICWLYGSSAGRSCIVSDAQTKSIVAFPNHRLLELQFTFLNSASFLHSFRLLEAYPARASLRGLSKRGGGQRSSSRRTPLRNSCEFMGTNLSQFLVLRSLPRPDI
ncbi:hypothetical protein HD806DRAFT_525301 [Xylariaceae sp. AK1471]|nr:hypothetical protein HD806DRAFT_525301 [Xylariaceae sp. AK1471]